MNKLIKLLFKPICKLCNESFLKYDYEFEYGICENCLQKILSEPITETYLQSDSSEKHKVIAFFEYKEISKKMIRIWKFEGDEKIDKLIASKIKSYIDRKVIIIPNKKTVKNDNALIRIFRNNFKPELSKTIIHKINFFHNQKLLSLANRHKTSPFKITKKILPNETNANFYILMDDIITTGNTMKAVLNVCNKQEIKINYCMALAISSETFIADSIDLSSQTASVSKSELSPMNFKF